MCSNRSRDKASYSLVIMMNKKTAEKIATIGLAAFLVIVFVIQNAHALSTTCPGFADNGKCLTIDKQPHLFGYYDGKQVDDSCDSTASSHTHQCIKGYTDAVDEQ
jgi:hypothetical protein